MTFGEQCLVLRKQNKSIIEIMRITGRSKTSIYHHIRNMPLSAARLQAYRDASAQHIRQFALARKGKSAREFRMFGAWTPQMVLLVAHLMFDGEILKGRCAYNNRSEALINRVEALMQRIYQYEPARYANPLTGVKRISYFNVALGSYLQERARELLRQIKGAPKSLKREFLRAFFDDEGCMDFRLNRKRVRGYQKDTSILGIIQNLLADFNIQARIILPNEVIIVGKKQLERFEKEINFSPGVYINEHRTNSRWKKNLEKRQLLRMAIESFKA